METRDIIAGMVNFFYYQYRFKLFVNDIGERSEDIKKFKKQLQSRIAFHGNSTLMQ